MDSVAIDTLKIITNISNSEEFVIKLIPTIITSIVAIAAVTIAYFQYRTNQLKLRHDLFEKRLTVYKATHKFIHLIIANAWPTKSDIYEFVENTRLSKFLFKKEISEYLAHLRDKGNELIRIDLEMNKLRRMNVNDEKNGKK